MSSSRQLFLRQCPSGLLLCVAAIFLSMVSSAQAQPPRGPRIGFSRGFNPGLTGTLMREEAQQELNLSQDQIDKVQSIAEKFGPQREEMQPYFERMREASDEEREKIREEMSAMMEKKRAQSDEEIKKLIGGDKVNRLQQLSVQFQGHRALLAPETIQKLELTDAQQEKIRELMEQRGQARRELGFRATEEEREAFEQEWNSKIFAILTPEQRQKWEGMVGKVIVNNGAPGSRSANFSAIGSKATDAKTNINSEMIRPDGPGEGPLASFGSVAQADPVKASQVDNALAAPRTEADESASPMETAAADETTEEGADPAAKLPEQDGTVGFGELKGSDTKKVSFNFRYAPWADVLKMFAELAGLTIDLNVTPPGTFNYYDTKEYTPLEALDVLNGYLLQKGYLLVRRDNFLVVLNIDEGIPPNLIPNVEVSELMNRGKNEIMRIRVPLAGIEADQAAREVEALLGPQGSVVPLRASNSLLVTDIGDNLRAISQLLESVTSEEDPEEVIFKQFTLENISASEAETMVRQQFGIEKTITNVSSFTGADNRRSSSSSRSSGSSDLNVTSDSRTQSLLVTAPRATMKLIEEFIKAIDVEGDGTTTVAEGEPYLKVYVVQNADAREITKTLSAIMPGVVVNEDGRSRRIHIVATESEHEEIGRMIKELDGEGGDVAVSVIPLSRLDPVSAAASLDSLFMADGEAAPVIQADAFGRRLLVRGSHEQLTQIKLVLAELGEDGTEKQSVSGPVISIPLGGRNAADMIRILQRNWEAQQPNPLKIVIPGARNPVEGEYVPSKSGSTSSESSQDVSTREAATKPNSFTAQMYRELELLVQQREELSVDQVLQEMDEELQQVIEENEEPVLDLTPASQRPQTESNTEENLLNELERRLEEPEAEKTGAASGNEAPPVILTVQGDNILVGSDDPEAITLMKELIQAIGLAMPPEKSWTLFYLQSTDATEVAYTLEQLIPDSSVSSSSGGDGSLMGSLMGLGEQMADVSGLSATLDSATSLKIIPETRLNALFVTGPNHLVAEVEQFLKVLDASDLPESLRDREPRQIPVEYADVNEVFNIVSDVYKDYLNTGPQAGGRNSGGSNPFAAMLMGQNSGGTAGPQLAKLTLGVDERTSQLIVSASDALFQEIQTLVESVDQSAKEANKTVRVVRLDSADPIMVQQTLQSLLPKVKVSATSTERRGSNDDNNNRNEGNRGDRDNDGQREADQFRRMMEQRMRERMQQGGGGGQDGGTRSRLFSPGGGGQRGGGGPRFGGGGRGR